MRALFLLFTFFPALAFATAQQSEKLLLDGKEEAMMSTPLEDYFSAAHPKPSHLRATSSACWRGYIGTWEIREGRLFLLKLEREILTRNEKGEHEHIVDRVPLTHIWPRAGDRISAIWFSGVLRVSRGEQLQYVHMGFGSVYEEDLFINVVKGRVVGQQFVDNRNQPLPSAQDLGWRELGRLTDSGGVQTRAPDAAAREEAGDWHDGATLRERLDSLLASKQRFKVRGLFFTKRLWLPNAFELPLDCTRVRTLPREGGAVELDGFLERDDDTGIVLRVKTATELQPGAAIEKVGAGNARRSDRR